MTYQTIIPQAAPANASPSSAPSASPTIPPMMNPTLGSSIIGPFHLPAALVNVHLRKFERETSRPADSIQAAGRDDQRIVGEHLRQSV